MENTHYDVIIIGAGLAGLTAAATLARSGRTVRLLERNPEIGGRARTDDLDGWLFNQGGHALYNNAVGHTTLRALGVEPQGEAPPLDGGQLSLDGVCSSLPIDAIGLARSKALGIADKLQFGTFLAGIGKLDPRDYADVTVSAWLADLRPKVRAVVTALVRLSTYSADPDLMSADAAIAQLRDGADNGVLYLHGGWGALCAQIAEVATAAGVAIDTSCQVEAITGGRTFLVATASQMLTADAVIVCAGGPALTARLLGIDPSRFGDTGPAPRAAVLDLALDRMPTNHRFVLGVDEPTYFSVHSPPARPTPEGKVAAVAMRYLSASDDGSAEAHRASLEHAAELAGATSIVRSRFLRAMTVTHGLPLASAGGMRGRPGVAIDELPGAFVAGDWIGERGLLADAAIASGRSAADAANAHLATRTPSRATLG